MPAYLILCPCFISRRKPARGKNACTGIAIRARVRVWCVVRVCSMLHVFWNERKRWDVYVCEHRRQKTPDRETERERGMYARFYGIGGTPELRARRRFVLSPFASSLPFSIALLPSRISRSLSLLLPRYMYCVQTCRYARVYLRGFVRSPCWLVSGNQSCANENGYE